MRAFRQEAVAWVPDDFETNARTYARTRGLASVVNLASSMPRTRPSPSVPRYKFGVRRYDHLRWGGLPVGRLSLCNLNEGCAEKAPILLHRRRTMNYSAYVGLDVHKTTIAIAVAEAGRGSEVRFFGEIANSPDALATLLKKLGARHGKVAVRPMRLAPVDTALSTRLSGKFRLVHVSLRHGVRT